jgi:hypothetical protein
MSSKDKGGNPERSQDEQKKPQDQRKQTRKFQPHTERKKDPEETPILQFGASNNF